LKKNKDLSKHQEWRKKWHQAEIDFQTVLGIKEIKDFLNSFDYKDFYNKGRKNNLMPDKICRELIKIFKEKNGPAKTINHKEKSYDLIMFFKILVNTEAAKADTAATVEECRRWGHDLVVFSSHDNPCPECAPLEGQVFSLSGKDPDFPLLPEFPPHPGCRHNIDPVSEFSDYVTSRRP